MKNKQKHNTTRKKRYNQNNIIRGLYKKKSNTHIIVSNNHEHELIKIHKDIEPNTIIKARLSEGKAIFIKAYKAPITLKEQVNKVLKEAKIDKEFTQAISEEASAYGNRVFKTKHKDRRDLTHIPLCTIDGRTAKDFDDAVFAQKKGKNIEVIVAIADVSYYVKKGSLLDEEAFKRGTSIYFPGHCVPMLPEQLSNGLCSLKPNVLRLAIAVSFEIGPKGGISKRNIFQTIIKSKARLTYEQVQNFYDKSPTKKKIDIEVQKSLLCIQKAAHLIRKKRKERGAIDFDITESVVMLDNMGEPLSIHPQDRLDSHRIIEDLMVLTNEIVAEHFYEKRMPCIYRVHEPPSEEKLNDFINAAQKFGVFDHKNKIDTQNATPKELQKMVTRYDKSTYKDILNNLMLRAMMQARYSEENLMHFGLASKAYLHFTSPIRRYADLMVHRQLRHLWFEKKPKQKISEQEMAQVALSTSDKEVSATDLERKIDRLYQTHFMAKHVGETFEGKITACTEFGFFVRLAIHHVEGLVHIAKISRQHVDFIKERMALVVSGSNKSYAVGDKVKVKLIHVNVERGHIDFELSTNSFRARHK